MSDRPRWSWIAALLTAALLAACTYRHPQAVPAPSATARMQATAVATEAAGQAKRGGGHAAPGQVATAVATEVALQAERGERHGAPGQGTAAGATGDSSYEQTVTFAVIGDYGADTPEATEVAEMVKSWDPAFVVSVGDGYYKHAGGSGDWLYDVSTGQDYCIFLAGITTTGGDCPAPGPSPVNRFFPALGNHDYNDAGSIRGLPVSYTTYFDLPGKGVVSTNTSGNERYYDFVQGPVHFFVLDSDPHEVDGISVHSRQAVWFRQALALSPEPYKIVVFHHAAYSSGRHGSNDWMQWPFGEWGIDAVVSGHDHHYERVVRDGLVYFVNGTGGAALYECNAPISGSQYCQANEFGAQRVTAGPNGIDFEYLTVDGRVRDSYHVAPGSARVATR